RVTVLCEGPRGTLTKVLGDRFRLDAGRHPQVYAVGVKEGWECPPGTVKPGSGIHTMRFHLDRRTFGGAFIYWVAADLLDICLVAALDYLDPRIDPQAIFQKLKTHPAVAAMLRGAKILSYGAKAIPEGGLYSMPRPVLGGCLIAGDSASMLNPMRLKGIHTAMQAGVVGAGTAVEAIPPGGTSGPFPSPSAD